MSLDGRLDVTVTETAVEFAFSVTNAGTEPVDIEFRSGQVADVVVGGDGDEVWRWSDDEMFTQAIRTETLAPGESLRHEARWEGPPAGEYVAEASLEAVNASLTKRERFEV
ncbi:MAG: BsuPI-related putative proteinase inhibitor [Haloferacaceae archaeon]